MCIRAYNNIASRYKAQKWTRTINSQRFSGIWWRRHRHDTQNPNSRQCRDPVFSLHLVTTVPAGAENPEQFRIVWRRGQGGKLSSRTHKPFKRNRSVYQAPNHRGLESCRGCPQTTAVTARHEEKCRIIGE